jgi:apolipoprotein N-acyltransferase
VSAKSLRQFEIRQTCLLWAESFTFAGASACLLLVARLLPSYWYLSLVALLPFLARVYRASAKEALRLGFLLGFTFFLVSGLNTLPLTPFLSIAKILAGAALFAAFGGAVGWTRQRWGFNPTIVALLWVAFELGLTKLGFVNSILGEAKFSGPFFHGLAALFGFLIISFIVVLCNLLIVAAIDKAISLAKARRFVRSMRERAWNLYSPTRFIAQKFYLVPEGRGPPLR